MTIVALITTFLILTALPSYSADDEITPFPPIRGYVQQETALRITGVQEPTKIKQILQLGSDHKFTDSIRGKLTGRLFYDAIYDLNENIPENVRNYQKTEMVFRESYLNFSYEDLELTLGKQQIVWGEVPGLFFADIVTAKDLREFILPDFEYLRIPQWAVNIQHFGKDNTVQLVWLPVQEFDKLPAEGSEFFVKPNVPANIPFSIKSEEIPALSITNGAVGMHWSTIVSGWNPALFYLYKYDSMPAYLRTYEASNVIALTPRHSRVNQLGYSISKDLDICLLKSEGVLTFGKEFSNSDANSSTGLTKKDFIEYVAGVEFYPYKKTTLSLQIFQRIILNHDPDIIEKEADSGAIVWFNPKVFSPSINPELLFVYDFTNKDWMFRPKLALTLSDAWIFKVGGDFFGGEDDGLFGRFSKNGRIYAELRYIF